MNNTKPTVTMHTVFDINTIPFSKLSDNDLRLLKDALTSELKVREDSITTLVFKSKDPFLLSSRCPVSQIRLPIRYSNINHDDLELHISSILNQHVRICTTSILKTSSENILLVRYKAKDDITNDDYSY